MKKHFSVLMLVARSSIFKLLGIFILMAATEAVLFRLATKSNPGDLGALLVQSRLCWVFGAAFLLCSAALCLTGCEKGGRQSYTLRRLRISEKSVFLWQAGYNTLCYFVLWVLQLGIVLALYRLWLSQSDPSLISGQTLFLAFYQNNFLHSLLPLDDFSRYLRNITYILSLGFASAVFPYRQRRGKTAFGVIFLVAMTLAFFVGKAASFTADSLTALLFFTVAVVSTSKAFGKEANGNEA